jgi:hypothetical protein
MNIHARFVPEGNGAVWAKKRREDDFYATIHLFRFGERTPPTDQPLISVNTEIPFEDFHEFKGHAITWDFWRQNF